jgi:tRNA 2-selenouridine synthase
VCFDVRSPGEFAHGKLPSAHSLPLFTDAERAVVGTLYKQQGQQIAFMQGLAYVSPKLPMMVQEVLTAASGGPVRIYCWRGGMRSNSVAMILRMAGLEVHTLIGGYKSFRRFALDVLEHPRQLRVLAGMTGVGKTSILRALAQRGEQVLDLEALAAHRGSAFGSLAGIEQPTNEEFENLIAWQWHHFDPLKPVWIEDESRLVGCCKIPNALFRAMAIAPHFLVERPLEERIMRLLSDYSAIPHEQLISATRRIAKKLGGARTEQICRQIEQGSLEEAAAGLLSYYDASYQHAQRRLQSSPTLQLCSAGFSDSELADRLCRAEISSSSTLYGKS